MKHLTIILTSAALALSVLNACASPKDGNEFKETALSGTPVRMDIPDTPINSVLSNNGHIVTLSKIEMTRSCCFQWTPKGIYAVFP